MHSSHPVIIFRGIRRQRVNIEGPRRIKMMCDQVALIHTIQSVNLHSQANSEKYLKGYMLFQPCCLAIVVIGTKEKYLFPLGN